MREGRFFRIPECRSDLERLWYESDPLDPRDRPAWLDLGRAGRYRYAGSAAWPGSGGRGRDEYAAELRALRDAGLVVDPDPAAPGRHRVYVPAPPHEVVWAVGIYTGTFPDRFAPAPGVKNPVLTRGDVTDIPAAFLADPFMVRAGGCWHMFFEVMNGRTGLGEIGLAVSPDGLNWKYRQVVLAEPFHLSYPYVFEWRGAHYMVPETYQAGEVRLYEATDFPTRWRPVATLLGGPYLVDASVFRHAGRWWMFVDASRDVRHDTLRLFHAAELAGPWAEHPRSPVVEGDPRTARPGGRVVVGRDRVVRYAQACVPHYGTAVRAFEVTELTPTTYAERELGPVLGPAGAGWNACGMHHIDPHPLGDGRWLACVDGWVCEDLLPPPAPTNT